MEDALPVMRGLSTRQHLPVVGVRPVATRHDDRSPAVLGTAVAAEPALARAGSVITARASDSSCSLSTPDAAARTACCISGERDSATERSRLWTRSSATTEPFRSAAPHYYDAVAPLTGQVPGRQRHRTMARHAHLSNAHLVAVSEKVGGGGAAMESSTDDPKASSGVCPCAAEPTDNRLRPRPERRIISRKQA